MHCSAADHNPINPLFLTAGKLVADRLVSGKAPLTTSTKFGIVMLTVSAVLAVLFVIFGMYAVYLHLLTLYVPHVSALFTAGLLLIGSLLAYLTGYAFIKHRRYDVVAPVSPLYAAEDMLDVAREMAVYGGEETQRLIEENPKTAILLASIAGGLLGRRY